MIKYLDSEKTFTEEIKEKYVIIDFYADWCGPCKMLGPVLDEVDFAKVLKINVDTYGEIAKSFGVMSIPTLVFMKDGLECERAIGYRGIDDIKNIFNKIK